MKPWDHLVEADANKRTLQRKWYVSGDMRDYSAFLASWLRSGESAEAWGLDSDSRYRRDFDKLVDYCRKKLKGTVVPLRGRCRPFFKNSVSCNVDFHLPGDKHTPVVSSEFQVIRIIYPNEETLRKYALPFVNGENDGSRTRGATNLFNDPSGQKHPWDVIRTDGNKALRAVFPGRLRPRVVN